ncbi:M28 family peptidase [Haloquadratum walsbyi]|jgi:Predicted aminopeptidases|uniref:Carboxypeptidase Q n=1 Tax=Haloquadratum walsbyi J07HQW2 TaxID=1238425 RepID=U1NIP6_9EURY|nr:M28 family peptidase [Haloquadratum walsbyi]ERG97095.1 MAG: putative aminopeptidase [Haloquadratum walsbyi J07HQW2]
MTDWIGETFTSNVGWKHLERLVDTDIRMAGSDGERRAAESTRDALAAVGARDAHLDNFEIQGWARGSAMIHAGDTTQDCISLPRSPNGRITGKLVDIDHGLPSNFNHDLDGAVVLAASDIPDWHDRYVHRREKYYRAVEAGAAAFIYRNHVNGCLPPTGSVGTEEAPIGEIPAVGVSKEVGQRLSRRFSGNDVTVSTNVDVHQATSQNIHADLGPETDTAVLLTSHVDAHDIGEGAADNAAGTAVVLEVARALAQRESDLDTRIHVIVYGAEEVGLVGSQYDADFRNHDNIKAIVNNDGVVRNRTLVCHAHGFDDLIEAANRVASRMDHPLEVPPELNPHSDHWPYVTWGVPGYHVRANTGDVGRGWGHTHADTLDKLSVRDLREQAILLTELVVELASDDTTVTQRSPSAIADQLERENRAEGMQVIGDWPYTNVADH